MKLAFRNELLFASLVVVDAFSAVGLSRLFIKLVADELSPFWMDVVDGLLAMEYLGAGCGRTSGAEVASNVVRAIGTGSVGLVFRSLLLTKFSLSLRKSGSSQLISVPR